MAGLFIAVCCPVCIVFGFCWHPLHFLLGNCIKSSSEWRLSLAWKKISNDCALLRFTGSMLRKGARNPIFFFLFRKEVSLCFYNCTGECQTGINFYRKTMHIRTLKERYKVLLFLCYTWWIENADNLLKITHKNYVAEPRTRPTYIKQK